MPSPRPWVAVVPRVLDLRGSGSASGVGHGDGKDAMHTGNTLASKARAGTRELMTRMGHSSTRAALIYQHMTSDRDRAIADRLGAMIRESGTRETPPAP